MQKCHASVDDIGSRYIHVIVQTPCSPPLDLSYHIGATIDYRARRIYPPRFRPSAELTPTRRNPSFSKIYNIKFVRQDCQGGGSALQVCTSPPAG